VNGADDTERLPSAIGPLVDLALHAYGRTFLLASLLSLGVFVVTGLAELAMPSHMDPNLRVLGLILVELLGCGFVVAVVALSVAADVAGTRLGRRTLLRGAAYRWAGVFGATLFAWATYDLTGLAGAITGVGLVYYVGALLALGLAFYENRQFDRAENVFVLNERIFVSNMIFSIAFLIATIAGFAWPK